MMHVRNLLALLTFLAALSAHAQGTLYLARCGDYDLTGRIHCPREGGPCSIVLFETSMAETEVLLRGSVGNLRLYDGHRVRVRAQVLTLTPAIAQMSRRAVRAGLVTGTPADARLVEERTCTPVSELRR